MGLFYSKFTAAKSSSNGKLNVKVRTIVILNLDRGNRKQGLELEQR